MTTAAEYQRRIETYDRVQLLDLWTQIQACDTPNWEAGKALEYLIIRAFQLEGADVTYPYSTAIAGTVLEQIDGAVYSDGLSCLVECKDQTSNVAIEPVAKLRSQLLRRPAGAIGIVFSTTEFTEATQILAQHNSNQAILLWDGTEIDYALNHQRLRTGLMQKYRYCVERALPNFKINLGDLP
jgi:Restriction endonuclease